jgi:UDP-N-acetylglucosamine/UDP-N-acetylgalactosamine diphosphorylase
MDKITSAVTSTLEKLHMVSTPETSPLVTPTTEQVNALKEKYAHEAQEHVFTFWDSLSTDEQTQLYHQLISIDPSRVATIAETVFNTPASTKESENSPLPESSCASTLDAPPETLSQWSEAGLQAIAEGKVAVLLMAGGQGTRLGSSAPKGCYDIGLPSGKSLFQLQAERLVRLQEYAAENHGDRGREVVIPWYIMTSGPTRKDTEDFLRSKNYFGLKVLPHFGVF